MGARTLEITDWFLQVYTLCEFLIQPPWVYRVQGNLRQDIEFDIDWVWDVAIRFQEHHRVLS